MTKSQHSIITKLQELRKTPSSVIDLSPTELQEKLRSMPDGTIITIDLSGGVSDDKA